MPWITPYIIVKDVAAALSFYKNAFGFGSRNSMARPDGKIMHVEVLHKTGVIMMGPEDPERGSKAFATIGGSPISLYVYVADVDAAFAKATAAGARAMTPPTDMPWGDRMCSVFDPEGYQWALATFQKAVKPEEVMKAMAAMAQQQPPPPPSSGA